MSVTVGSDLLICATLAVVVPVFPERSLYSNVKLPLSVNVYTTDQELLVTTMFSLALESVAITSQAVAQVHIGLYKTSAVGDVIS